MKIAIVSLSYLPISDKSLGGLEVFVSSLESQLVKSGHEVTLFGLSDSEVKGKLNGIISSIDLMEDELPLDNKYFVRRYTAYQSLALLEAIEQKDEFDVIHVNLAEWQLGFVLGSNCPNIVVTAHGNYMNKRLTKKILEKCNGPKLVTVSHYVANNLFPEYQKKHVVYNGIDVESFSPNFEKGDYLVWLGRITPIKAPHLAIEAAQATGEKLIIAGGIDYSDYFETKIAPYLDDKIQYVGPVFGKVKNELLANAKACLVTSDVDEAFGLVAAEAMACGTPVIATNRGALPEVVKDGESGFIVSDVKEIIEKIKIVDQIPRRDCRDWVKNNFSLQKMTDGYLEVYAK